MVRVKKKKNERGVEGLFAEEVPFHGRKAPALLALMSEYTIFILITPHRL